MFEKSAFKEILPQKIGKIESSIFSGSFWPNRNHGAFKAMRWEVSLCQIAL